LGQLKGKKWDGRLSKGSATPSDQRQLEGAEPISQPEVSESSAEVRKANPGQYGKVGKLYEDEMEGRNSNE